MKPAGLTLRFGSNKTSRIAVGGKDHTTGLVELGGILVAGTVVEEVGNCFDSGLSTVVDSGG